MLTAEIAHIPQRFAAVCSTKIKHIRNMAIKKKEGVPTGAEGNSKGASVKMLKGAIKIDGKVYALKTGVQIRNRRGTVKLMTRVPLANGKVEFRSFDVTPEGVKAANELVQQSASESAKYGSDFGALQSDERRGIELVREYQKECVASGVPPMPFSEILAIGLKQARAVTSLAPLFPAVMQEYLDSLADDKVSASHLRRQVSLSKKMCACWADKRITGFSADDVRAFMKSIRGRGGDEPSPWTLSANQGLLGAVFNHAVKRKYLKKEENPMEDMDAVKTATLKEPEVLTNKQAKDILLLCATSPSWQNMLPSLVLGLLCGIRASERARLRWSDIRPGNRDEIYLSRAITKTNFARVVPVSAALSEWMDYFATQGFPMGSDEFIVRSTHDTEKSRIQRQEAFINMAKKQGLKMPKNVLRHTAASNLSVTQGRCATSDMLGHNERMLVKHYRRAMTKEEAEELLNITPRSLGLVKPAESAAHNGAAA